MDGPVVAIIAAAVLGFIVRVFNIVVEWLAKVLGVEPPAPIDAPDTLSVPQSAAKPPPEPETPPAP